MDVRSERMPDRTSIGVTLCISVTCTQKSTAAVPTGRIRIPGLLAPRRRALSTVALGNPILIAADCPWFINEIFTFTV